MSIFQRGSTKVDRRVLLQNLVANTSFAIPAGAKLQRVYARNKGTVATNLSVGNAAAGAQFLAATAVPVASSATDVTTAGLISEVAISVAVNITASTVYLTFSVAPGAPGVDVCITYDELLDSLAAPALNNPVAY